MKFSIIVPIYKVEKYLNECVDSVLNQSFEDFELILVDDGSPDRCPQICDEYAVKDSRVKVIHKENGGLSDARNAGIKAASGEYLCFIDSDDYWIDNCVLVKINDSIENSKSGCDIVLFGRMDINQKDADKPWIYDIDDSLDVGDKMVRLVETGKLTISACQTVISRTYVLDNNLFFTFGIKSEDIEWSLRSFSLLPRFAFVSKRLYVYRSHREGSITTTVDYKHLCDYCDIIEKSITRIQNCPLKIKNALMSYIMYHTLIIIALTSTVKMGKKEKKLIKNRTKSICKKYLLDNKLNKKVRICCPFYVIGGYPLLEFVLGFYLNNRGR